MLTARVTIDKFSGNDTPILILDFIEGAIGVNISVVYPFIYLIAIPVIIYFLREFLAAKIRESVRADFESEIERVRSDLRKNEELFRNELQLKENQMNALREGALAGRSHRQAIIAQRKIDALDTIWQKFKRLAALKFMSEMFAKLNLEEIEKKAPKDPKIRQFVDALSGNDPLETLKEISATNEQIYVPDIVWAIYSAYSSILTTCYIHMKALSLGVNEAGSFIKWDLVANLAKAVLPHQTEFIDKFGPSGLPHLLDEIEQLMVSEVRKALEGKDSDEEAIKQSAEIMQKVEDVAAKANVDLSESAAEAPVAKQ